ncbi:cyclic peptide export ABC transporter [Chitinophaga filiformis]|uniref:Cyclic peptide export ABC transporter n=1 Tax=Chitinophaga filiformis TaxID=104663 RepID=A0ABY4I251_CHIFI|nr:cyclic peptide export ABC transporter [Chitinophaga filiformis]UPK68831.1 cyclic peptide export ABC transporter [Chitinophaga filiformis]
MYKISLRQILFLLMFSVPNTLLTLGILVIVNGILSGRKMMFQDKLGIVFFSIVGISFLLNIFFQRKIIAYSYRMIYENEMNIMRYFLQSSLSQLEKIGMQRVYGVIEDMRIFTFLPGIVATTITSIITLLICLFYFLTVSVFATIVVVAIILTIAGGYFWASKKLEGRIKHQRELNDRYFRIVDDVLRGFKELKLSDTRRNKLYENFLRPNRATSSEVESYVAGKYLVLNLFSQYGLYLVIGVVLFVLPVMHFFGKDQVSSLVVVLFFIRGPINSLIAMQSFYTKSIVANRRISAFLKDIKNSPPCNTDENVAAGGKRLEELRFEGVKYHYQSASSEKPFSLGPVDLTINEGETVFIIGGNGSGKSTFINLLTGISSPHEGKIFLNGKEVRGDNQHYRNHISAVFSDHHLFYEHYEQYSLENNGEYERLLKIMELDKVIPNNDDVAARKKFSKGQGKRMAMIFALLEERPVLVLDEWAADQDPYFRKFFYERLLPELRAKRKTIIAVTHDDAYFRHADRIVKFDYGKVAKDIFINVQEMDTETLKLW